jgi:prepilin-type N-terminal cleavage/methylation domain-containing protein
MNYKLNKAYTLIELLIVIAVIAILSTIAFITLTHYSKQARDTKRLTDARSLI